MLSSLEHTTFWRDILTIHFSREKYVNLIYQNVSGKSAVIASSFNSLLNHSTKNRTNSYEEREQTQKLGRKILNKKGDLIRGTKLRINGENVGYHQPNCWW